MKKNHRLQHCADCGDVLPVHDLDRIHSLCRYCYQKIDDQLQAQINSTRTMIKTWENIYELFNQH